MNIYFVNYDISLILRVARKRCANRLDAWSCQELFQLGLDLALYNGYVVG